jgi:hypothetical protein
MNLKTIQKALQTLDEQVEITKRAYKDKPLTKQQKLTDLAEVRDILQVVEKKIQERTKNTHQQ